MGPVVPCDPMTRERVVQFHSKTITLQPSLNFTVLIMYGHGIEVKTDKDKASVNWECNSVINHRFILCCHEEYTFMIHQSSGVHVSTI